MVSGRQYSRRYVLHLLRRRGVYAAVPFVLAVALAIVVARSWPNLYYAQATVIVSRQQVPESYVRTTVIVPFADRVRATREGLKTPARIEALINEFDLYPEARLTMPMQAVVAWMTQRVHVEMIRPDAVVVGFGGYERTKVAPVANRLTQWFIEDSLASREVLADTTSKFLDQELESARARLREQEQRVQRYREQYAGELPTQVGANLQILQGAYAQLQTLAEAVRQDRERRDRLQDELGRLPATPRAADDAGVPGDEPTEVPTPEDILTTPAVPAAADPVPAPAAPQIPLATIMQRLRAARATLNEVQQKYTPEHPDVVQLRALVERLETAAKNAPAPPARPVTVVATGPETRRREIEAEIRLLDARIAEREGPEQKLRQTVGTYQARVEGVPRRESEWADLTRDYATLEQAYTSLLSKKSDSRVSASLERQRFGEQMRIAERPVEPTAPISPNRPRLLVIGVFVGLFLGAAALAAFELFDTGLRGETEVLTTLRLPVLAMLPVARTPQERRRSRYRIAVGSAIVGLIIIAGVVWRSV